MLIGFLREIDFSNIVPYLLRETTSRFKPTGSMSDLSRSVIDLAISTIKKTHHGVTITSVSERLHSEKEVGAYIVYDTNDIHDFFSSKLKATLQFYAREAI